MNEPFERLCEQALVLRCQAGDDEAFRQLVVRLDGRLRRFVAGLAGGEADDAVQEAWFDAYRKMGRLDHPRAFRGWLFRIARDKAYAILRKRRRLLPLLDEEADPGETPDLSPEELERMRACLDRLPLPHREALLLSAVEGLSYEEVAEATDCPVGTVRSRIHYAKRALRRLMEEPSHGE